MDLKVHLEKGWGSFLQFIGPALLLTFVQIVVSIFSLGILAPVTAAGYFQSLLLAQREGRTPVVKDLFAHMSLFLPLLAFGFVSFLAVALGFVLLVLPGFGVMIFIVFACLYLLPLMTDQKLGLIDAIKESWNMAVKDPIADHIIITIVYIAIISIGGSLPLVILLAQPLATFILLSFYDERLNKPAAE
ncbi:hypothetical protein [Desulfopila inferna]|uniref:hypothetical protein n=1 Tax=Desulfopila inferna TaxID=468528 RepID=UPI00196524FF|nr:hypothetical protein [Desulfopila inferna]MBM9603988.1 hypothetical protein [Desulfopila inferna]